MGDPSGPYNAAQNPGGLGNEVSDNVDFIPWQSSPPNPLPTTGSLSVSPTSMVADGVSVAGVTLTGAQPGHKVRFSSSLAGVQFGAASGIVDVNGQFVTYVMSSMPGTAQISATDLTVQSVPSSPRIEFTPVGDDDDLPFLSPLDVFGIVGVTPQSDLSGLYPIGLGAVSNRIEVHVNWYNKMPGKIRFRFNTDAVFEYNASGDRVRPEFRFDQILHEGVNSLEITAIAADGVESESLTYSMIGWTAEARRRFRAWPLRRVLRSPDPRVESGDGAADCWDVG